jgi:hypothetical protein
MVLDTKSSRTLPTAEIRIMLNDSLVGEVWPVIKGYHQLDLPYPDTVYTIFITAKGYSQVQSSFNPKQEKQIKLQYYLRKGPEEKITKGRSPLDLPILINAEFNYINRISYQLGLGSFIGNKFLLTGGCQSFKIGKNTHAAPRLNLSYHQSLDQQFLCARLAAWSPIQNGKYDLQINTEIGLSLMGILYLSSGYNFDLNRGSSSILNGQGWTVSLGIHIPLFLF